MDPHVAQVGRKEEIAAVGKGKSRGPFEGQPDLTRVGPRRHDEVVLQFALVPVIGEIDAWIGIVVLDLGIGRNVGAPLGRVVADEVFTIPGSGSLPSTVGVGFAPSNVIRMTACLIAGGSGLAVRSPRSR